MEKNGWVPEIIKLDAKFIIRTATEDDRKHIIMTSEKKKSDISHVWKGFSEKEFNGCWLNSFWVNCENWNGGELNLRTDTMRFSFQQGLPLLADDKPTTQALVVSTGSCSTF